MDSHGVLNLITIEPNIPDVRGGGLGLQIRGPWRFYGAPKDTVAIRVLPKHDCFGPLFPLVEGVNIFPLPTPASSSIPEVRMGLSYD
jgi:hypothetical protein